MDTPTAPRRAAIHLQRLGSAEGWELGPKANYRTPRAQERLAERFRPRASWIPLVPSSPRLSKPDTGQPRGLGNPRAHTVWFLPPCKAPQHGGRRALRCHFQPEPQEVLAGFLSDW